MSIPQDGKYYLVIANCHPTPPNFNFSATLQAVNPHGHLSVRFYGILPFYRCMFWIFFPLTCIWTVNIFICYKDLLRGHKALTVFLIIYVLYLYIQYYALSIFNEEGTDPSFPLAIYGIFQSYLHMYFHLFLIIAVLK